MTRKNRRSTRVKGLRPGRTTFAASYAGDAVTSGATVKVPRRQPAIGDDFMSSASAYSALFTSNQSPISPADRLRADI